MLDERLSINASWLLALRWAAVGGQLVTILSVWIGLKAHLPIVPLFVIIGLTAFTNITFTWWFARHGNPALKEDWSQAGYGLVDTIITLDILLLTALLYYTGGSENPFSVFYLVNLALAAVVIQSNWIYVIGGLSILAYTLISIWNIHLPLLDGGVKATVTGLAPVHIEGMVTAFAAAIVAITYFVARLTREVRLRDDELKIVREREAGNEKLESLATLAAGAAHELATPLSTIAVVARELERHLESSGASAECVEDARLIRNELAQCRQILDRMAGRAGESVGEGLVDISPAEIIEEMLRGLPGIDRVKITPLEPAPMVLVLPRVAIGQALRGLVKNALDAAGPTGQVAISCKSTPTGLSIYIQDNGPGMSPETLKRAGEPFFTTKQPGEGTGLGLFLARAVLDRLGGSLELSSEPGAGTTAKVLLRRTQRATPLPHTPRAENPAKSSLLSKFPLL